MGPFDRHLAACNNLPSFVGLLPLRLGPHQVGWVDPARAAESGLPREGDAVVAADAAALAAAAERAAAAGHYRLRGELFDVRAAPGGPVLAQVDRGALPTLGILAEGVHLNGRVRRADGLHLWVGFRSREKRVAPGQLDNLVAGGTAAGHDPWTTLVKEAAEEAGLPAAMLAAARPVARISYVMASEDGVRRDVLHAYDLDLPEAFMPTPMDDEMERFELWPVRRVLEAVRDTDRVKFNVNLVLIDLFLREGLIDPSSDEGQRLRAGLRQPL